MRKLRTALIALLAVVLALAAADLYLLISPRQVEKRIRALLGEVFRAPFDVREIRFSLRSGLKIRGLVVRGPEGERTIAVDEATVGIDWRRLSLGEVRVIYPELDLRRGPDGKLSLIEALNPAFFEGGGPTRLPRLTVAIEHAAVRYRDAIALAPGQVVGLDDVDLDLRLSKDGALVRGSVRDPLFKQASFDADFDARSGRTRANLEVQKARIEYRRDIRARIPPVFWKVWDQLRLHGTADLAMRFTKEAGAPLSFRGEVVAISGGLSALAFPYPVKDASGTIRIESEGDAIHVILEDLHGTREGGAYRCDGDVWGMSKGVDDVLDLRFDARDLPIDDLLFDALPPKIGALARRFNPAGRGSARVRATGLLKPKGTPDAVHISVDAEVQSVTARFEGFPVPAKLTGRVSVRDERFMIETLSGTAGGGALEIHGFASPDAIDVRIDATGVRADEKFEAGLLPAHREILERLSPRGVADARIDVTGERGTDGDLEPTFAARISPRPGLTVRYADFPYPLVYRSGEVAITPAGARLKWLEAGAPQGPLEVTLTGVIRSDTLEGGGVEIRIDARHLPIDETLRAAAAPHAERLYREIGPERGEIESLALTARIAKKGDPLELLADARLRGVAIRPARAPIPFTGIAGLVHFSPGALDLEKVEGRLLQAPLRATGTVSFAEAVSSTARLTIDGLELDEELRAALPEGLREAWARVRPQGTLAIEVAARGGGSSLRPEVRGRLERGAFLLSAFPLAATALDGDFYEADGLLRLDRLSGKIGAGRLDAYGYAHLGSEGGPPRTSLHVAVRDLPCDARLIDAFPEARRRSLSDLDLGGTLGLDVNAFFDPAAEGGLLSYTGELRMASGKLDVGLALTGVDGTIMLHGSWPLTRVADPELGGGFLVRRALWKGQPLERFTGRFAAGGGLFEVTALRGEFLGGLTTGRFYAFSDPPRLFGAELRLAGGRLERWAQARYSGKRKASGLVEGEIAIAGESAGAPPPPGGPAGGEQGSRTTLRGEGDLRIREARLWELPLFAGLLNTLSLELPGRPVFDNARIRIRLENRKIVVDSAEISSPALSFYGKGTIVEGNADLRLVPELGRNWLGDAPIVGPGWRFWKEKLVLYLEVRGPLDDPQIRQVWVNVITGPIRWLFEREPNKPSKTEPAPSKGD